MNQLDKAELFRCSHRNGNPILLYNIWDAGSAKAIVNAGAKAIATSSWSIAAAHGYADGELLPLNLLLQIAHRIVENTDVPVTVDFEGGYAEDIESLKNNVRLLLDTGAIGLNFEDQRVGTAGLYSLEVQAKRIKAVREACLATKIPIFINARTDLFLQEADRAKHAGLVEEAMERAKIYKSAGADGFFIPALTDLNLIATICEKVEMPVNVMMMGPLQSIAAVSKAGVARISYGPSPYLDAVKSIANRFASLTEVTGSRMRSAM